mgnify:FL=1
MHLAPALRRWGVSVDGVQVGARAGLIDPDRGWSEDESEAVFRELMHYYETFLKRVAEGRKRTRDEIDAVAQGRVYTGIRAQGLGLVDQIGGLRVAIDLAAQHADLDPTKLEVERIWPRPSRGLAGLLRGASAAPLGASPYLGEALAALEEGLALARVGVLAYCPLQIEGIS